MAVLADIDRFHLHITVAACTGLAPGQQEGVGKSHQLHLEKIGSKHLRWILAEAG